MQMRYHGTQNVQKSRSFKRKSALPFNSFISLVRLSLAFLIAVDPICYFGRTLSRDGRPIKVNIDKNRLRAEGFPWYNGKGGFLHIWLQFCTAA